MAFLHVVLEAQGAVLGVTQWMLQSFLTAYRAHKDCLPDLAVDAPGLLLLTWDLCSFLGGSASLGWSRVGTLHTRCHLRRNFHFLSLDGPSLSAAPGVINHLLCKLVEELIRRGSHTL